MCSQPSCDKWARSPDAGWCPWLCRANAGARRTQKVLALAQARKVDVILVTELTPWGRSARFAARSLTCFKFRFVSSPLYTSERNDGHEDRFCRDANYNPSAVRPPTGRELWRRWQFVYTGNARVPCWIVRVPKDIIWGHMGLWSDNSIAMFGALYRLHFPLTSEGKVTPTEPVRVPNEPDVQQLNQDRPR